MLFLTTPTRLLTVVAELQVAAFTLFFALLVSAFLGWSFQMGSAYQFHSWRVFVLVCAFPSVAAICALTTMPESPRFYLEVRFGRLVGI